MRSEDGLGVVRGDLWGFLEVVLQLVKGVVSGGLGGYYGFLEGGQESVLVSNM